MINEKYKGGLSVAITALSCPGTTMYNTLFGINPKDLSKRLTDARKQHAKAFEVLVRYDGINEDAFLKLQQVAKSLEKSEKIDLERILE